MCPPEKWRNFATGEPVTDKEDLEQLDKEWQERSELGFVRYEIKKIKEKITSKKSSNNDKALER